MSIVKANKVQSVDGTTYTIPIQTVRAQLGVAGTASSTAAVGTANENASYIVNTTTTSWTDSSLQVTIIPKFSTSIIKIEWSVFLNNQSDNNGVPATRIRRGTNIVWQPQHNATGPYGQAYYNTVNGYSHPYVMAWDVPNTTNSITYVLQYRTYGGGGAYLFGYPGGSQWAPINPLTVTEYAQ